MFLVTCLLPLAVASPMPVASPEKNSVVIHFISIPKPTYAPFRIRLTTVKGESYTLYLSMKDETTWSGGLRNLAHRELIRENWLVDSIGNLDLIVHGVRDSSNRCDRVKSLVITALRSQGKPIMKLKPQGKAVARLIDGKAERLGEADKTGPSFNSDTYVEFELGSTRTQGTIKIGVETTLKNLSGEADITSSAKGQEFVDEAARLILTEQFLQMGFKAAPSEGTKFRVYGASFNGAYYPVTRGIASSKSIPRMELPKVTNPGRK